MDICKHGYSYNSNIQTACHFYLFTSSDSNHQYWERAETGNLNNENHLQHRILNLPCSKKSRPVTFSSFSYSRFYQASQKGSKLS